LGLRVQNTLRLAQQQARLARMEAEIERRVELRTAALIASRREALQCLARAGEYRDHGTGKHVLRVSLYAGTIARELGLAEDQAELIEEAALLHDIGKIGISDYILLKPNRLTPAEFNVMKQHCLFGRDILRPTSDDGLPEPEAGSLLCGPCAPASVMKLAASIAMSHHEWWDGQGYPLGRAGEQIPLEGRITAVADVYDALSSRRPYKPPYTSDQCFAIMRQNCGRQFDPRVFEAFLAAKPRILEIQAQYADEYALPMPDLRQEDIAVIDLHNRKSPPPS
jgi:putative two-component system response regulator